MKEFFFAEKDRFVIWLPVLFGFGIGLYFLLPVEPPYWITILVVELLLVLIYIWRYHPVKYFTVGCLMIIALGFSNIQIRSIYQAKFIEYPKGAKEVTYLKGQIIKTDYSAKGKKRLLLTNVSDFDNTRKGFHRITLTSDKPFNEGSCVEMVATLMPPMPPVLPDSYQFNRKSFYEEISAVGYTNSNVYEIECNSTLTLLQKLSIFNKYIRQKIVTKIYKKLSPDEASITAAILAGEKTKISPTLYKQYRDSGLAHFLSISGLHMSMIAAISFFIIRLSISLIPYLSLRYNSKKSAAVFAIFMSFIYLLISGAEIPAQRAFIMTFIVLLGILFNRNAISMRMLSFAALIVLAVSPYALISASFQMSFAAVLVLIAFYEKYAVPINSFLKNKNIATLIMAYIIGLLVSDLVASLATLPFAAYHFNTVAVYTTLGNLLAGPVIGLLIMPFILLSLFLMPFNLYELPLKVVGFGIKIINDITLYVSSLPNAGYQVLSMPFWGLFLIIVGGLWLCIWQQKWRLWGIIPIILGMLSMLTVSTPDFIYDAGAKTIAVKDNNGNLVVITKKKNNFIKQMWLEKTANQDINQDKAEELKKICQGKTINKNWLDLECENKKCSYKNKISWDNNGTIWVENKKIDVEKTAGGAVYITKNKTKIKTIRSSMGKRLWN